MSKAGFVIDNTIVGEEAAGRNRPLLVYLGLEGRTQGREKSWGPSRDKRAH